MIDYNKAVKAWHSWPTWAFLGQLSRAISAHLLSHHFQGSGVWHAFTGSSAQGLPQAESRFQVKLLSHLGHGTLSQAHWWLVELSSLQLLAGCWLGAILSSQRPIFSAMRPCPQRGCFGGYLCCFNLSDFLCFWPPDPLNVFLVVCFYESFKCYHFSLQRNDVQLSFPIHLSCVYIKCHWLYVIRIISVIEICSFENIKTVTTHQSGVEEVKGTRDEK